MLLDIADLKEELILLNGAKAGILPFDCLGRTFTSQTNQYGKLELLRQETPLPKKHTLPKSA